MRNEREILMGRLEEKELLDKPRRRHNFKLSVRSLKMYA
jgi:hypothetical protein